MNDESILVSDELTTGDPVFTGTGRGSKFSARLITSDMYYNSPDEKTYIFKNTHKKIFQSSCGIVKTIRNNSTLESSIYSKLKQINKEGVIVVKYHYVEKDTYFGDLVNYYKSSIPNIDKRVMGDILERINWFLNNKSTNISVPIRIIKFIPFELIEEHGIYKDEVSGVELATNSPKKFEIGSHVYETEIKIGLDSRNRNKFYLSLGDEIIPLYSNMTGTEEVEGYVKIDSMGVGVLEDRIDSCNLSKYGIYNTKKEAEEHNNLEKHIEVKKINIEEKKLKHEEDMMILKRSIALENQAFEREKRKTELIILETKLDGEKYKHVRSLIMEGIKPVVIEILKLTTELFKKD